MGGPGSGNKKNVDTQIARSPWGGSSIPPQLEFRGVKIVRKRSEGQRMFLYVDGTLDALKDELDVSRQSIVDWRQGLRQPDDASRLRILDVFGIPVEAWAHKWNDAGPVPGGHTPPSTPPGPVLVSAAPHVSTAETPPPRPPVALPPPEIDDEAEAEASTTKGGTTVEHCLSLLAVIRRDRLIKGLTAGERVKLVDSEARMLKLLADLQERAELSEDRYVREHPSWVRLRNAIAEALRPHPAAAEAVMSAIERLGL